MKSLYGKLSIIALITLTPAALLAQARSIVYGRTTVTFTPAFVQALASNGATLTDLSQNPLQNGVNTLTALEGVIDLQTSFSDVLFSGGYQVTVAGQTIRVQDLAFEATTPTTSFISGIFIVNGMEIGGRQPIFAVNARPTFTLPLQPQNGTITLSGLSLGLTPAFVNIVNTATGQAAFTPGTQVGTAEAYAVLSATN
jgi:hypothetical protein